MSSVSIYKPKKGEKVSNYTTIFAKISRREALCLIEGLCSQMIANSPNVGRYEFYPTDEGHYFSIAVEPEPTP